MTHQRHNSAEFRQNAQAALESGTFEEVLNALGMKLLELGVPGAETPDVADRVNHPLKIAYIYAETQEARDRAWDGIAARIFRLSSLLPPEEAEGAFLADRVQMETLVGRYREFWENKLISSLKEDRKSQKRGEEDQDGADGGLPPSNGDIFEGLGKPDGIFSTLYSGVRDPYEAPLATGTTAASGGVDKRAVERQFFEDALLGSPLHGDVQVIEVFNNDVLGKLLWGVRHNSVNDVLWALTAKTHELGMPAAPTEEDTTSLIVALTLSYVYVTEHNDTSIRREAVDTLRLHLLRVVGLIPREVWVTDFLDTREGVLALIEDRAQDGGGDSDE